MPLKLSTKVVLDELAGLDEVQPDVVAVGPRLADQLRSIIDDDGWGKVNFKPAFPYNLRRKGAQVRWKATVMI